MARNDSLITRRQLLRRTFGAGAAIAGSGFLLAACEEDEQEQAADLDCTDVSGLDDQQRQTRETLAYTDESPEAEQRCNNCRFFEPAGSEGACGGCQIMPGPVHPLGWCKSWAATEG